MKQTKAMMRQTKTITVLMKKLGEAGIGITLRYDTMREQNCFTLIGPQERICDTDAPFEALCRWVMSDENLDGLSEIREWIVS